MTESSGWVQFETQEEFDARMRLAWAEREAREAKVAYEKVKGTYVEPPDPFAFLNSIPSEQPKAYRA